MNLAATLRRDEVTLRPLRRRDAARWQHVRRVNADWLRPWEATLPQADEAVPATFGGMVRTFRREAAAGRSVAFALDVDGVLMGQVTLGGLAWGSLRSGYIGYWIAREAAGRGVMPRAVAMVTDHGLGTLGLHRIEINIRPENSASLRVAQKLGYRREGYRTRYLHIDGDWRDHVSFVMLAEERPSPSLFAELQRCRGDRDAATSPHRYGIVRDTGGQVPPQMPPHP